jgi:biopolymer transport protein ExbD
MRRGRRHAELNAEINVVSLIDVMMLLLVIFMITAPIMHGGVDVKLPTADAPQMDPNKSGVVVTVTGDKVYIGDTPYSYREFSAAFKAVLGDRKKEGVYIGAQGSGSVQQFLDVMDIIKKAGVENMGIMTSPRPEGAAR